MSVTVSRGTLMKLLPLCGSHLSLTVTGGKLVVRAGAAEYRIPADTHDDDIAADELFNVYDTPVTTAPAPVLAEALRRVLPFVSTDDTRPVLTQVAWYPRFLADLAAAAPVERLTLNIYAPLEPVLVEAARDRLLLMPIRIGV